MIPVYIGWDPREVKAWHLLSHSILEHTSEPVSFIPLHQKTLRQSGIYWRSKDQFASTEFSLTRFLVPYLSGFKGYSIFMDCDMLCQGDLAELITLAQSDSSKACWVVKHHYTPTTSSKMDGCQQTMYPKKNWSSLMVFNNSLCTTLYPDYVNAVHPSELHQLKWVMNDQIGEIDPTWNWLVGEYAENPQAKLLHYTLGGPWFQSYTPSSEMTQWIHKWQSTF